MIKTTFLLALYCFYSWPGVCFAADQSGIDSRAEHLQLATLSFIESPRRQPAKKKVTLKPAKSITTGPYEVEGYIGEQYVRLVLEVENRQTLVGFIYDDSGNSFYVSGEYLDDAIQLYDDNGKQFTVITK